MDAKLGAAYVEFGGVVSKFNDAYAHVQKTTLQAGASLSKAGMAVGTKFAQAFALAAKVGIVGIAGAGAAAGAAFFKAVKSGSDLNEVTTAVEQTFGKSAGIVTGAAQELADKFGTVKKESLEAAVGLGAMFQGMGKTDEEAAKMSVEFTKLAGDLSSFRNIPFAEALMAIRSGLSGEAEPLKRFGVGLLEADVAAMGWAMGLAKVGTELTNSQKQIARAQLITVGLNKAQGDLARTQDGLANRSRKATGNIENAWADLGTAIQPAAVRMMEVVGNALGGVVGWFKKNQAAIAAWADYGATKFSEAAAYLGTWSGVASSAFGYVASLAVSFWGMLSSGFAAASEWVASNMDVLTTWGQGCMAAVKVALEWVGKFWSTAGGMFKGVLDVAVTFTRTWSAIWADVALTIEQWWLDFNAVLNWIPGAVTSFGGWFFTNFPSIFVDACSAAYSAVTNFFSNVKELFLSVQEWLASGLTVEFGAGHEFKDLMDGFKRTSPAMPDIGGPNFDSSDTDRRRAKLWEGESRRLAEPKGGEGEFDVKTFMGSFRDELRAIVERPAAAGGMAGKLGGAGGEAGIEAAETAKKAEIIGVSELGKKVQESQGKDDVPKKQLKIQEQTLEANRQQVRLLEQRRGAVVG